MRGGVEQHLVFVLAVQIDEPAHEIAQRRRRGQGAIDERPTSALRGNFPADDGLSSVRLFEHRLNGREILAGADQIGRGAAAD